MARRFESEGVSGPMIVKFSGNCWRCGIEIPKGTDAAYERLKGISHYTCSPDNEKKREETSDELADRLGFKSATERVD